MSQQIQFRYGQPVKLISTKEFQIGAQDKNGPDIRIYAGQEIEYDGMTLNVPGYPPTVRKEFKGAITKGWVVPIEQYDPNVSVRPTSAPIQSRRADGSSQERRQITTGAVEEEERHVGSVKTRSDSVKEANKTNYRRTPGFNRHAAVQHDDARVVGNGFNTPTNFEATNINYSDQVTKRMEQVRIQPGEGLTKDQLFAAMSQAEQVEYEAILAARRQTVYNPPPEERSYEAPPVVGRVANAPSVQREGMTVNTTVGGGISYGDVSGQDKASANQVQTFESEGMRFTTTNGPKVNKPVPVSQEVLKSSEDVRRKVAKIMCADFPDNYDFDKAEPKKIARLLADYDDRPDIIQAVFAAESDSMKVRLVENFPEVFAFA